MNRRWTPYDEPDYTLYRKGWEIGSGVHIATGNYSKSFTGLSISSPEVKSDFVRTYNSMSDEEGSFGIGWDFNIDVSKIEIPATDYYKLVLPDGSNTTFKDYENDGFECLNARNTKNLNTDNRSQQTAIRVFLFSIITLFLRVFLTLACFKHNLLYDEMDKKQKLF